MRKISKAEYEDALVKTANVYGVDPYELHNALTKEAFDAQELLGKAQQGLSGAASSIKNKVTGHNPNIKDPMGYMKATDRSLLDKADDFAGNLHGNVAGGLKGDKVTDRLGRNVSKGIDAVKDRFSADKPQGDGLYEAVSSMDKDQLEDFKKEVGGLSNTKKLEKLYGTAKDKMPGGGKGLAAAGAGLGAAGLYGAKKLRNRNKKEEN